MPGRGQSGDDLLHGWDERIVGVGDVFDAGVGRW
jgi:hypothetical protein